MCSRPGMYVLMVTPSNRSPSTLLALSLSQSYGLGQQHLLTLLEYTFQPTATVLHAEFYSHARPPFLCCNARGNHHSDSAGSCSCGDAATQTAALERARSAAGSANWSLKCKGACSQGPACIFHIDGRAFWPPARPWAHTRRQRVRLQGLCLRGWLLQNNRSPCKRRRNIAHQAGCYFAQLATGCCAEAYVAC